MSGTTAECSFATASASSRSTTQSETACCSFPSELKGLLASGLVDADIDPEALEIYLTLGMVPAPLTLLRGCVQAATRPSDRGRIRPRQR